MISTRRHLYIKGRNLLQIFLMSQRHVDSCQHISVAPPASVSMTTLALVAIFPTLTRNFITIMNHQMLHQKHELKASYFEMSNEANICCFTYLLAEAAAQRFHSEGDLCFIKTPSAQSVYQLFISNEKDSLLPGNNNNNNKKMHSSLGIFHQYLVLAKEENEWRINSHEITIGTHSWSRELG